MRAMGPLVVQQMAENHYRDLVQLAQAAYATGGARPVRRWRQWVGQALVTFGVGVGAPRQRRAAALSEARCLLLESCGGRRELAR